MYYLCLFILNPNNHLHIDYIFILIVAFLQQIYKSEVISLARRSRKQNNKSSNKYK